MEYVINNLSPKMLYNYFEEICAIPHGSGNEAAIAQYICDQAESFGLWYKKDAYNNVLVKKPASAGSEDKPALLLQGHIDMVCEKNADTDFDFLKDGIRLVVNGDILTADGTTLGADDGSGVAYMLTFMAMDNESFPHPPLEFCFTSGEELGFVGALHMDLSDVASKQMIGLDAGPEGVTYTTSAGAQGVDMYLETPVSDVCGCAVKINISGLLGGHSALNINDEKGNANKLLGRLLHNMDKAAPLRIASIKGGAMKNAIPREATAVVVFDPACKDAVMAQIDLIAAQVAVEYAVSDPDILITAEQTTANTAIDRDASKAIINALYCIPNGVRVMSREIPGLPVTSTNMGVVSQTENGVNINTFLRSSSRSINDDYVDHMTTVASMCGFTCTVGDWLPAWPYKADDKLRSLAADLYKEQTGQDMKMLAVHGGLELGIFSEAIPGLEIVTIGCNAGDCHTVTEWMSLSSFANTFEFLKDIIAKLS